MSFKYIILSVEGTIKNRIELLQKLSEMVTMQINNGATLVGSTQVQTYTQFDSTTYIIATQSIMFTTPEEGSLI